MTVKVVLSEYLKKLRNEQKNRPIRERLIVPGLGELAQHAAVSRAAFSEFAKGRNERINTKLVDTSIRILREYGHETELTDIIVYIPDKAA